MKTHVTNRQRSGKPKKGRFKFFRKWHSYLGITASFFIIVLAVTGILLNHADDLALAKKSVDVRWVISIYGIRPPVDIQVFIVNDITLATADDQLYFSNQLLKKDSATLKGVISTPEGILAATSDEVLLLSTSGELIDTIDEFNNQKIGIEALGQSGNKIVIKIHSGILQTDSSLTNWSKFTQDRAATWSKPVKPTVEFMQQISHLYQSHIISWERVIQDIHSGRMIAKTGKYLDDIVAILLILLALSGIYMWLRSRKK